MPELKLPSFSTAYAPASLAFAAGDPLLLFDFHSSATASAASR
jgi:hypothetical protein